MSASIDNLAQAAVAALDNKFALTPERDMEEMKAEALAESVPSPEDPSDWLVLASITPGELIIENTQVYAEIYANGCAIVQAALDAEADILLNP